ncbi:MAG: hypothetical protein A3C13_00730 [Candidatus Lloydbacteria bacterium RIFCSPHIGHO2_02_FULL_50_11]|nr:MAG: hypothetical protein A3C13_00730 [Candidatus Lloydbacteria bacterium RIFCSPHIGHO2_02_FULL_50_11]
MPSKRVSVGNVSKQRSRAGFSLVELIVVIAIIGLLSSVVFAALGIARTKARDAKRKVEITQIGKFLSGASCYLPDAGGGTYDLAPLVEEFKVKYPQYVERLPRTPRDPRLGTDEESRYVYAVTADGQKCALYANLENRDEAVTLPNVSAPGPGGGTGVLQASTDGWNGTPKYFQVAN